MGRICEELWNIWLKPGFSINEATDAALARLDESLMNFPPKIPLADYILIVRLFLKIVKLSIIYAKFYTIINILQKRYIYMICIRIFYQAKDFIR